MKTKIEIKSFFGDLLFTYEAQNATIKDAVEQAVKEKVSLHSADLHSADLSSADLRSADLRFADLHSADLRSANLRFANLRSADLRFADLHSADLRFADLHSADLHSADLRSADLSLVENKENAKMPLFCKWHYSILGDKIQIGCEKRTIDEWDKFFASKKVLSTERGTKNFKQIEAIYNACKAYLKTLS